MMDYFAIVRIFKRGFLKKETLFFVLPFIFRNFAKSFIDKF